MKATRFTFLIFLALLFTTKLSAQEFYTYIVKSVTYLVSQRGQPNMTSEKGSTIVYRYNVNSTENHIYGISNGKVYSAIKSILSPSLAKTKSNTSIQILHYLAEGFSKQGNEAGMTILKKGSRVLTIGYMDKYDGNYSTIVSALR